MTKPENRSAGERWRASWLETDYEERLDRAIATPRLTRCATIAIVSPKGGVGKTTLTVLLGSLLARVRRDRIVAVDTNPDFGSLGRTLTPDHQVFVDDLGDVLEQPDLSVTALDRHLGRAFEGLMVLPAPTDPSRMAQLNEESYRRVISRLQTMVGVLVLDCGTGLQEPAARAAQAAADQIVLVSDAHPSTASLVAEAAELLRTVGPPLTLLVNKMPRKRDARLDLEGLESLVPDAHGPRHARRGPAVGDQGRGRRLLVGRRAGPVAARDPRARRVAAGRLAGAGDHDRPSPRQSRGSAGCLADLASRGYVGAWSPASSPGIGMVVLFTAGAVRTEARVALARRPAVSRERQQAIPPTVTTGLPPVPSAQDHADEQREHAQPATMYAVRGEPSATSAAPTR